MMITISSKEGRFGCRSGAIIYNQDKTKVLMENQDNGRYMFPGGRLDMHEDSKTAIIRELKEELNIEIGLTLKYILEMFLVFPKSKYHEIGFYYLGMIDENVILNHTKSLDGNGVFEWINITQLEKYNVLAKPIKDALCNNKILTDNLEHIIYKEY